MRAPDEHRVLAGEFGSKALTSRAEATRRASENVMATLAAYRRRHACHAA
jgi:hypothetical protein